MRIFNKAAIHFSHLERLSSNLRDFWSCSSNFINGETVSYYSLIEYSWCSWKHEVQDNNSHRTIKE